MKVAIHQPQYIPWPGYFAKILSVDTFILYDSAQYQKNSIINRNKLLMNKKEHHLTIPTQAGRTQDKIKEKKTVIDGWRVKHLNVIKGNYPKCNFYPEVLKIFEKTFDQDTDSLCEINCRNVRMICEYLGITTQLVLSSQLNIDGDGDATQKNLDMVKKVSGKEYISGEGGKNYLKEELFSNSGIKVRYFHFLPTDYPQHGMKSHVPGLSIIDLIANVPKEEIIGRLKKGWVEL